MYYLDPKNDISFKKVFGRHPEVLKSFLNALLPLQPDSPITEIEYLNPELLPDIPELKFTMVDMRCRDKTGRQFLVEMQMLWADSFESRILLNACKAFSHQIGRGDTYDLLAPVYSLNIINQSFSGQSAVWYHQYALNHQSLPGKRMNGLEFVLIELPNFMPANYKERRITTLWLRFLKEIKNRSTMIPQELLEVPEIAEAVEALKDSSYSREELEQYEKYWDILRTQQTFVNDALRKGRLEGQQIGQQIGEQLGQHIGEHKKAKYSAEKLIIRGFSNADIADITGLGIDEIEALRKEMN
jgi:predicted transposase/invertase (TIGR01784 family)